MFDFRGIDTRDLAVALFCDVQSVRDAAECGRLHVRAVLVDESRRSVAAIELCGVVTCAQILH